MFYIVVCCFVELEGMADQCYRTKQHFPQGNHVLQIIQHHNNSMINLAYLVTW